MHRRVFQPWGTCAKGNSWIVVLMAVILAGHFDNKLTNKLPLERGTILALNRISPKRCLANGFSTVTRCNGYSINIYRVIIGKSL